MLYKASGMLSFAQGDLLTVGAFIGWSLFTGNVFRFMPGLPYPVAFIIVAVVMFFLGVVIERVIIRRLIEKKTQIIYVVLATIAISFILQNGAMLIWGTHMHNYPEIFPVEFVRILGVNVRTPALLVVGVAAISMVGLHIFMNKTKYGTAMRAATMDPLAARSCGVNVSFTTSMTWGIAASLAGIAGVILGPMFGVFVILGASIGFKGFAGAVIGGYGNMYGAIIGGILFGLLETFVSGYLVNLLNLNRDVIAFSILLIFLFIRPTGLFNESAIHD
jgi:branched-chain amino acid transport system permease protein